MVHRSGGLSLPGTSGFAHVHLPSGRPVHLRSIVGGYSEVAEKCEK